MNKLARIIVLAFVIVVLSGCYATSGRSWSTSHIAPTESSGTGWVAASIGVALNDNGPAAFQSNAVGFKPIEKSEDKYRGHFRILVSDLNEATFDDIDIVEDNRIEAVMLLPLQPGNYHINSAGMSSDSGTVSQRVTSEEGMSYPFSVTDGQITYLGNFIAHTFEGRNFLGMRVRSGAVFVVSDQSERDLEILFAKHDEINADTAVLYSVPELNQTKPGLFVYQDWLVGN